MFVHISKIKIKKNMLNKKHAASKSIACVVRSKTPIKTVCSCKVTMCLGERKSRFYDAAT